MRINSLSPESDHNIKENLKNKNKVIIQQIPSFTNFKGKRDKAQRGASRILWGLKGCQKYNQEGECLGSLEVSRGGGILGDLNPGVSRDTIDTTQRGHLESLEVSRGGGVLGDLRHTS